MHKNLNLCRITNTKPTHNKYTTYIKNIFLNYHTNTIQIPDKPLTKTPDKPMTKHMKNM